MQNQKLQGLLRDIEFVSSHCAAVGADLQCQAHWGRYLCVMVTGFLENALYEVYLDYLERTNRSSVRITRTQNPKSDEFWSRAERFNFPWVNELKNFMNEAGRGDAIDSIMNLRHQIAHGQSSTITIPQVSTYLLKCVDVIDYIEAKLINQANE